MSPSCDGQEMKTAHPLFARPKLISNDVNCDHYIGTICIRAGIRDAHIYSVYTHVQRGDQLTELTTRDCECCRFNFASQFVGLFHRSYSLLRPQVFISTRK